MKKVLFICFICFLVSSCKDKNDTESEAKITETKIKQIAEIFNAKIVSKDINNFNYTIDFQNYFSEPNQYFVFDVWAEDIMKQNDTIMARFSYEPDIVIFLKINQEMLQIIKSQGQWSTFLVVAAIDRIHKPFFGLTGNVEDFEIEYVKHNINTNLSKSSEQVSTASMGFYDDRDYEESYPVISGNFYIEVAEAPLILYGRCISIESTE